jgi:hypothetical protein
VTDSVVISSCPSSNSNKGKISVYRRPVLKPDQEEDDGDLELIMESSGQYENQYFGDQLNLISSADGLQTLVYAVSRDETTGLQTLITRIEVIINNRSASAHTKFYVNTTT